MTDQEFLWHLSKLIGEAMHGRKPHLTPKDVFKDLGAALFTFAERENRDIKGDVELLLGTTRGLAFLISRLADEHTVMPAFDTFIREMSTHFPHRIRVEAEQVADPTEPGSILLNAPELKQ